MLFFVGHSPVNIKDYFFLSVSRMHKIDGRHAKNNDTKYA